MTLGQRQKLWHYVTLSDKTTLGKLKSEKCDLNPSPFFHEELDMRLGLMVPLSPFCFPIWFFSFPIYLLASQSCKIFNIAMSYAWSEMLIKLWPSLIWACQVMCQVQRLLIRWCCDQTFLWQWADPHNGRDADSAVLLFLSFSPFSSPSLPQSFLSFPSPF